jgi:diguanylate cyclase (GGDEF)-like protein/PAS domain S-box-containing protein
LSRQVDLSVPAGLRSERFLKTVTDAMPGMIAYWDRDLRCRFANQAYLEWFGRDPESLIGDTMLSLLGEQLFALNEPYVRGALAGVKQNFERRLTKPDGSIGYTWANYIPDVDDAGDVSGFFVLVTDVTPMKSAQADLRLAASVFNSTIEGIIVTDEDGVTESVNPAFTEITGYAAEEVVGRTTHFLKSNLHDAEFYVAMWRAIKGDGWWRGEIWNTHKNGQVFLQRQTVTKIHGAEGESARFVGVFSDITELWRRGERLKRLAFRDALTDLPNRTLLEEKLGRLVALADREKKPLAVMFLDLDGFKAINDQLGHDIGDALLKIVATRLQSLVRRSDTVVRLGGDEFVILLDNPADEDFVAQVANRILAAVDKPFEVGGQWARVGLSIGIAMCRTMNVDPAELIKQADGAMYAAKRAGGNTFRFDSGRPSTRQASAAWVG